MILTKEAVAQIRPALGKVPVFDQTLEVVKTEVDIAIENGMDVPVPKDLAGGYTHEQHKRNFFVLQKAGLLFQITGDEKYAVFVRDMLFKYRNMYPEWERHPQERSYARGKIFWQCLNDANWLVYVSQAYDCIYDWLSKKERKDLNKNLFRPMADFLSVETPKFFNRIHNHSTWATAAVGMIGLVMNDKDLVDKALYGLRETKDFKGETDNDGALIMSSGKAGFIAQIDHAFSPDGYYTEGPYYQRYAMYPFLIFSAALHNTHPELKILEYRDGVLIKAVRALLNQTNGVGEFFPLNDAQKGMSYYSRELTTAISLAYTYGDQDPTLLELVKEQNKVPLDGTGFATASAIAAGKTQVFKKESVLLRDGADGQGGAIGVLRSEENEKELSLVMKYAKHGMGHGHFDRLSYSYYNHADEVLQDYGAARWVNIEQKDGGGYLKENKTWGKQTIAHNTVVVDRTSQFKANVKKADSIDPKAYIFDTKDANVQLMSAKDSNAYKGIALQRTMVMIKDKSFENPIILDLFRVDSDTTHMLELPFYYKGHLMKTNFAYKQSETLKPMGDKYGYQHLWAEAEGKSEDGLSKVNWFGNNVFYTLTTAVDKDDELVFGRIGASDPKFNLRRDPVYIIRKNECEKRTVFASVLETHGSYSRVTELSQNIYGAIKDIEVLHNDENYTVVSFSNNKGDEWTFAMANQNNNSMVVHEIQFKDKQLKWQGSFTLLKNDINN